MLRFSQIVHTIPEAEDAAIIDAAIIGAFMMNVRTSR
jgi:hypothetical protein